MVQTLQRENGREIAKGVGLTSLLYAGSLFIPFIGMITTFLIPLPTLFYRLKLGQKGGAMVAFFSFCLFTIIFGELSLELLVFGELLLTGFLLGECMQRGYSMQRALLTTSGTVVISGFLIVMLYHSGSNSSLIVSFEKFITENREVTLQMYKDMGLPPEDIRRITTFLEVIGNYVVLMAPGIVSVFSFFISWVAILLAKPVFERGSVSWPGFLPFSHWKVPEQLVWGVIASGILMLIPDKSFRIVGLNVLIILFAVYFTVGMAILSDFFDRKSIPGRLRIIFYGMIILFFQISMFFLVGLGIFDIWFNFRKLNNDGE